MEIPEGEERSREIFEEIMTENSPVLMTNIKMHIQETEKNSSRINAKKYTHRYI